MAMRWERSVALMRRATAVMRPTGFSTWPARDQPTIMLAPNRTASAMRE